MPPNFVRPEDRQRSGGAVDAAGAGADDAPVWRRSEAFAEDLAFDAAPAPVPRANAAGVTLQRWSRAWRESFGLLTAAALAPRRTGAVD